MKKILYLLFSLFAVLLFLVVSPAGQASAAYYPGTSITLKAGDVLYSPKTWSSTKFIGHVAIVGPSNQIIHSHPVDDRVVVESVGSFATRHAYGDAITIYRPKSTSAATNAAAWALNNAPTSTNYSLTSGLYDVKNNYCSKWVWQSFYLGAKLDIVHKTTLDLIYADELGLGVTPAQIRNSSHLSNIGSFKRQ